MWTSCAGSKAEARELEPSQLDLMLRQVAALAVDLRELMAPFDQRVRVALAAPEPVAADKVYLVGDGDSYHASCAAEMAFESIAQLTCEPLSAQRFLDYGAAWMRYPPPERTLVIAASASGVTKRLLQAIERAREHGALTIALTGRAASPVTEVADRAIVVDLPRVERSPGIRTYQASLVGMLLLAIGLRELRTGDPAEAGLLRREMSELADRVEATSEAIHDPCRELAEEIADSPTMVMVGSGPSYGTALFSAAKVVEASGVHATPQDLEEWWHVDRFVYPTRTPLFVIAPPGRSHWRAGDLAAAGHEFGRRVIAVVSEGDAEVAAHASSLLPVQGEVREEFSPLLYHLFADYVACYVARWLGRSPFQSDNPAFARSLERYRAGMSRDGGR